MNNNLKYWLRLRLRVRELKREVKELEEVDGDPLERVQAIAKIRRAKAELATLNDLSGLLRKKYGFKQA